jgi:predicted ATPase
MRLDEVTIGEFKNLHDLHVDFDESSPYTVLVGENGAGKSNLIEALSLIFRNLDLDQEAPFTYNLKYRCRDHDVEVRAQADQYPHFSAKRKSETEYNELPRKRFMAEDVDGRPITPGQATGSPRYSRGIGSDITLGSSKRPLNEVDN